MEERNVTMPVTVLMSEYCYRRFIELIEWLDPSDTMNDPGMFDVLNPPTTTNTKEIA